MTRYGVLSDIHGNLHALQASINDLRALGVDRWICAGDIVGYGPQPNECVETIMELGAICVAGNHELLALDRIGMQRSGSLCRETAAWTRATLSSANRSLLDSLPHTASVDDDIVVTHGSLNDPEEYVRERQQALTQLDLLEAREGTARVVVLGHTHEQLAFSGEDRLHRLDAGIRIDPSAGALVNPGAVGQSRHRESQPRARHLLIDTESWLFTFRATAYDTVAARAALRRRRLPPECLHVHPGLVHKVSRRVRRAVRRRLGEQEAVTP